MDKLEALQAFAAAAENGSLAAGGRMIGKTRDQMSKLVSQLENHLGTPLFTRSTRQLTLTRSGTAYLVHVKALLKQSAEADRAARHAPSSPSGTLRLHAPMMFGIVCLAPLLPEFLKRFPEIRLDVSFDDRHLDLAKLNIEMAIRIAERPDTGLAFEAIGAVARHIFASPGYLARHGRPSHPDDLVSHSCLRYGHLASGSEWVLSSGGEVSRIAVNGRLATNTGAVLCEAALQGLGLSILPDFLAEPHVREGRLEAILASWELPQLSVFAIFPPERRSSMEVKTLFDFLSERLNLP